MIKLAEQNKCTGCMACKQVCPKQCIEIKEDILGNIYPWIDRNKCVECGRCMSVCPELDITKIQFKKSNKAYAAWSLNKSTRSTSTSGGMAAEFYESAINQGYYICGVEYLEGYIVTHKLSKQKDDILKFQQSKYVFSHTDNVYKEIEEKLKSQEKVLFVSLPCKVAGLLKFLEKTYSNLVTVDIVCHGTPASRQLSNHIIKVDKKNVAERLFFRNENEIVFQLLSKENKKVYYKIGRQDPYLAAFLEGLNYRESCYQCRYARPERISDITICDFWGLGTKLPFEHPYTGAVSAVLINTTKGNDFVENCKNNLFLEERPVEEAVNGNAQLNKPTPRHPKRDEFERMYGQVGFEKSVKIVLKDEIRSDKKKLLKRQLRSRIRKMAGIVIPRYRS